MYIQTNSELLTYIPNVFASAVGENPLYDKIQKFLSQAELWINTSICSHAVYGQLVSDERTEEVGLIKQIEALDGFLRAIPFLDLVLTPNGFGVVSNQNVAPASKERVANLRAQATIERDMAIEQLFRKLHGYQTWCDSPQGKRIGLTVIQSLNVAIECGEDNASFMFFLKNQREMQGVQRMIALNFVSEPIMNRLCHNLLYNTVTDIERPLIEMVHEFIIGSLKEEQKKHEDLDEMVNYIKKNIQDFPEWESSDTALLFNDYSYENEKDSKGFWF